MTISELRFLTPELSLLGFALVLILLDLFIKQKKVLAAVSIAGVLVSAGFTVAMWGTPSEAIFSRMLAVDNFALFFKLLLLSAVGLVILASQDYVSKFQKFQGEYYALLLISAVGMMLLVAAADMISIYVALELSGISLYVLASFLKDQKSSEAGLKYLLLGAFASAFLLFGIALIYGATGTTNLERIFVATAGAIAAKDLLFFGGMGFLLVGMGFKVSLVPFHMWTPDVYEGAPTPVTAFMSVAVKAAGFAILIRVVVLAMGPLSFESGLR